MHETYEMTKMHDGYSSQVAMNNINPNNKVASELYASYTDLLDLIRSLIKLNWDIMHNLVPSDVTELNRTKDTE